MDKIAEVAAVLAAAEALARDPLAACTSPKAEMALGRLRVALDNYLGDRPERPSEAALRLAEQTPEWSKVREGRSARAAGTMRRADEAVAAALRNGPNLSDFPEPH